jgi:hypothetical protein
MLPLGILDDICQKKMSRQFDPKPPSMPQRAALPLDSKGSAITKRPAAINKAPLVYTGAAVWRSANMATMGFF